jgi:hypothetical protein
LKVWHVIVVPPNMNMYTRKVDYPSGLITTTLMYLDFPNRTRVSIEILKTKTVESNSDSVVYYSDF